MLGFVFGLNARLGRLHFFLATVALAIAMTAICFAIAMAVLHTTSPSMIQPKDLTRNWAIIAAMIFFGVATFMLQSMRIRDIGWDPVCVIPGWIVLMVVDHVVAGRYPAWAIGAEHQGTAVGGAGQPRPDPGADVLAECRERGRPHQPLRAARAPNQ